MDTIMEKRIRRRMVLLKSEKDRAIRRAQFGEFSTAKSFDEIKEEREAAIGQGVNRDFSNEERDIDCDASLMSDCVSEMRRRRVYEMTHGRPYPTKSTKKKHTFWQPEDSSHVAVLSPPFAKRSNEPTISKPPVSLQSHALPKKATPRVLWKVETANLNHSVEAVVLKEDNEDERQRLKDSFIKDEIIDGFGYEDDEIMTPVRIKKFINAYDDAKNNKEEREGISASDCVFQEMDRAETAAAVSEISSATQALAAFVTSAVGVMREAKTPEKDRDGKYLMHLEEIEPKVLSSTTPYKSKLFHEKAVSFAAVTPSNKLITKVPTPKTMDSSMDEADIMVTNLGLGESEDNEDDSAVGKLDYGVLWPSLFQNEDSGVSVIDTHNKKMLEALVEGGALQREVDGTNVLKLFVDMYHKHTFERIVHAIQELKGLQALVICRAINKDRPTYRTTQEIKSLFDSTKRIQTLHSLMLLNFTSDSSTDLGMLIHSQPSLYRLQIQMVDGTLNGELLGVMATAPCLTHVLLELNESCSLGTLLNSRSLQTLRVNSENLEFKSSHIRTLFYSLQSNIALTSLDLAPPISAEQFRSLCLTLKHNYRLESLRVNLELTTGDESRDVAMELANLFRENNFLINVWNYSHKLCAINDEVKRDLFAALRNSKGMKDFKFFNEDIGDWKNAKGGNPAWLEENLNSTIGDCSTVNTVDVSRNVGSIDNGEGNDSLFSFDDSPNIQSNRKGDFLRMCGFESPDCERAFCGIDVSDMSKACDYSNLKKVGTEIHKWATGTATAKQ